MPRALLLLPLLLLVGCASTDFTPNKAYRVTGGYLPNNGTHLRGNEFLFSVVPPAGNWGYTRLKPWFKPNLGYIEFVSFGYPRISLHWVWKNDVGLKTDLASMPHLAPWMHGADPKMERIPYSPTEYQLKSGDWYQPGYRQTQWHHFRYLGQRPYYCLTSLSKSREGLIEYGERKRAPYNTYWYTFSCPLKVTDGRDASFIIRTTFSLTDEQLKENPNRIEENIAHIDKILEPSWDSLVIMPQAYQFEPPAAPTPQP